MTIDEAPKDDSKKGRGDDKKGTETDKQHDKSKHKRSWNLLIKPDKWENIYGIENVMMKDAELKASFEEGNFCSTVKLELSAELKLGDGTFKVQGQISRDDNFVKAEMKLKLSSKKSREEKTTRKALELNGKVTFNEHSSAVRSLAFGSKGVTVQGGISDVKIPNTEIMIKKAGLEIFFRFKSKKIEEKPDEKSGDDKRESDPTGENEPEMPGKVQDGDVEAKSLVKSSDKNVDRARKRPTIKLTAATLGLEEAHARKAVDEELRHAGKAIMDLPAFRSIETGINEAARKIGQFGKAIDGLVNRGLGAYLEEMLKDEREGLNRQIILLEALMKKTEELEAACKEARRLLTRRSRDSHRNKKPRGRRLLSFTRRSRCCLRDIST
ncbi:hypothetical protein FNYG_10066 [Fusarium nygamai]|uniref:Uncharacterized protein n=1 Tax=Gibberella nygamai TaxID=42673 RepID=A0A2K0W2Z6_GIBNY|nr:hypothetical protein FNYG_10066 [Fusarium nygamai]